MFRIGGKILSRRIWNRCGSHEHSITGIPNPELKRMYMSVGLVLSRLRLHDDSLMHVYEQIFQWE